MPSTMRQGASQPTTMKSQDKHKERAYVAASRRTDRSIEARLQSARMASEIHQKRTGKAFRISEAIILNEEMYEEDDDYPRSLNLLPPHMMTASPEMNSRVDTYMKSRARMSAIVTERNRRESEVTEQFAQLFPEISQALSQPWSASTPFGRMAQSRPDAPNFKSFNYDQASSQHESGELYSGLAPDSDNQSESNMSQTQSLPYMDPMSTESSFTSEFPPEMTMLMGCVGQDTMMDLNSNDHGWMYSEQPPGACKPLSGLMGIKDEQNDVSDSGYDGLDSGWNPDDQLDSYVDDLCWDQFMKDVPQAQEN